MAEERTVVVLGGAKPIRVEGSPREVLDSIAAARGSGVYVDLMRVDAPGGPAPVHVNPDRVVYLQQDSAHGHEGW